VRRDTRIGSGRTVIDGVHGYIDGAGDCAAVTVVDRVGEAGGAVPVGGRGEGGDAGIGVVGDAAALGGLRDADGTEVEVAVDITREIKEVDRARCVFIGGDGRVGGGRGVV